jgi:hypothetical protein
MVRGFVFQLDAYGSLKPCFLVVLLACPCQDISDSHCSWLASSFGCVNPEAWVAIAIRRSLNKAWQHAARPLETSLLKQATVKYVKICQNE